MPGRAKNIGVNALARELGLLPQQVSVMMSGGLTKEQIREKYKKAPEAPVVKKYVAAGRPASVPSVLPPPPPPKPVEVQVPEEETYSQADLRLKIALANEREQKVAILTGKLREVDLMNAWFGEIIVTAVGMMTRIGSENRDRLAAEDDPGACQKIIDDEVRRVLDKLKVMDGTREHGKDDDEDKEK